MTVDRKPLEFPTLKIRQSRRLDGGVVVEGAVQGAFHYLRDGRSSPTKSLIPLGANFGTVVSQVETGAGLTVVSADKVTQRVENRVPDGRTPTADLVLATSYKQNSKAIIRLEDRSGENPLGTIYFEEFSLQTVSEPQDERFQVHEVFDGEKIFFFGRRPRFWTYSGIVKNAKDAIRLVSTPFTDQFAPNVTALTLPEITPQSFADRFVHLFKTQFAGTKALESNSRIILTYEDIAIEGMMTSIMVARNSEIPAAVNITFTLFVLNDTFINIDQDGETLEEVVNEWNRQNKANDSQPIPGELSGAPKDVDQVLSDEQKAQADETKAAQDLERASQEQETTQQRANELQEEFQQSLKSLIAANQAAANDPENADLALAALRAEKDFAEKQANFQDAVNELNLASERLAEAVADKNNAQETHDHAISVVSRHTTELAEGETEETIPLSLAQQVLATGGVIDSSVKAESGTPGVSTLAVQVSYPNGKSTNRDIKTETIFVRVKS